MITRPILEAQREMYAKGKDQAVASANEAAARVNAFNGAIEAIDHLLTICAQEEEAQAAADKPAESEGDPNA
jgi:hypothetical protein